MKLTLGETSLVVAGAWNPAIVTPEWIIRHGLELDPVGQQIQAVVPAAVGFTFEFPRFTLDGLTFVARPDALVLSPTETNEATVGKIVQVAAKTLTHLTHTPVAALGYNFQFEEGDAEGQSLNPFTAAQEDLVEHKPEGWDVEGAALAVSWRNGDSVLNIQRALKGSKLTVKFNFHHQVANAAACVALLQGDGVHRTMFQAYEFSRQLVIQLYGGIDE